MKPAKWPFRPDHITSDGEKHDRPSLRKLTGVGIITNEYLQGIQTSICANLENPTTIVEFSPSGEPVRTDSRLLVHDLHPPCAIFREYTEHEYCHGCDNRHALLFYNLGSATLSNNVEGRIKNVEEYYRDVYEFPELKRCGVRTYLEYDCPLLGYRELIFPIFFEDRVIAVFFVGEICLEDKLDLIERRQKEFFAANPQCFDLHLLANSGYRSKDIVKMISLEHRKWIEEPLHVLGYDDYGEVVGNTCGEIDGLERTLIQQMRLERESYVKGRIEKRIWDFRDKLPRGITPGQSSIRFLWQIVKQQLEYLREDFAIRYVIVFGVDHLTTREPYVLDVVAYAGELPGEIVDGIDTMKFNLLKLPATALTQPTTSVEDQRLFDGLGSSVHSVIGPEHNLVRTFPVPFSTKYSIAILVGYYDWNPHTSVENRPDGYLDTSVQSFYGIVLSALSSVLAAIAQDYMEATFRILGHELGQLSSGLDWLRLRYMSTVDKVKNLSDNKIRDLQNDIRAYLRHLYFLSNQSNMLIELPELRKEEFPVFGELLLKWRDIYRMEAERRKLDFVVPYLKENDPERPPVYGDKRLLEQLVYNVVNNCIKYCYRGTNIRLDCRVIRRRGKKEYVLTVTDYGLEIEKGHKPYDLYYRGDNVVGEEGLGLGLYISEQIAKAHNGSITHRPYMVSQFNVPLIQPYLELDFPKKDASIIGVLHEELDRLRKSGRHGEIVALRNGNQLYRPSEHELQDSINKPTWEVVFELVLPAKEDQ